MRVTEKIAVQGEEGKFSKRVTGYIVKRELKDYLTKSVVLSYMPRPT